MVKLVVVLVSLWLCVSSDSAKVCKKKEKLKLTKTLSMVCKKGKWMSKTQRAAPGAPPCEDNPALANNTCPADRGHCKQFTERGAEMDRDCPGTCESCDGCRCQDNHQWHKYCSYWAQYCNTPGTLGTWMTANCRKTCGKCRCKCCSYKGKQHALGARILLPEKCGELVCEEGLVASSSPLLAGAARHTVSHPDELTLNFHVLHKGADCCVLPGDGRLGNGSTVGNGSMVEEGWKGHLQRNGHTIPTTCCHGTLSVPLTDVHTIISGTSTPKFETTTKKVCIPSESLFGSIGISIDNTGSVSSSSVGVMSLTNGILDKVAEDGFNIPTWVLTTFNDGGSGTDTNHVDNTNLVVVTSDIRQMNTSLNAIRFSGGGDGPERATQGMLLTLQNLPKHGVVLVFTDHQTKDLDLVDDIIALKNEKDIQIHIALAPTYNGRVGDESWVAYQNISNGNVFNLADFSRDQFIFDIVQIIGNSC